MSPMTPARRARWPWVVWIAVVAAMLIAAASFFVVKVTARLPVADCPDRRACVGRAHGKPAGDADSCSRPQAVSP